MLVGNGSGGYTLTSTSSLGVAAASTAWGTLTGSILNQADLQTALNNKLSSSSLPAITTLASLSLPYSQVTGGPTSMASSTLLSDSNNFLGQNVFSGPSLADTGGLLSIGSSTATTNIKLNLNTLSGYARYLQIQTGGSIRWQFGADNNAESGNNVGSDMVLYAYTDAGTFSGTALAAYRSSGPFGNGGPHLALAPADHMSNRSTTVNGSVGDYYNLTDRQATSTLTTNPIETFNGSSSVAIYWPNNALNISNGSIWVDIQNASAVGGVTLSGWYQVTSMTNATATISVSPSTANASTMGGGSGVLLQPSFPTSMNESIFTNTSGATGFEEGISKYYVASPYYYTPSTSGQIGPIYQSMYDAAISPSDSSHSNYWNLDGEEMDIVNRGADEGYNNDISQMYNATVGIFYVPENLPNFGGNEGRNDTAATECVHNQHPNSTLSYVKWYQCYVVSADSLVSNIAAVNGHGGVGSDISGSYEPLLSNPITTLVGSTTLTITVPSLTGNLLTSNDAPTSIYWPQSVTVSGVTLPAGTYPIWSVTATTFNVSGSGTAAATVTGGGAGLWFSFNTNVPFAPEQYTGEFAHGLNAASFKSDDGYLITTTPGNNIGWGDGIATSSINVTEISSGNSNIILTPAGTGNVGIGTTTPGSSFSINGIANFAMATSTFYSGMNLTSGCYAIKGTCIGSNAGTFTSISTSSPDVAYEVPYWSTTSGLPAQLTDSPNFVFTGSALGIGSTTPQQAVEVGGNIDLTGSYMQNDLNLLSASATSTLVGIGAGAALTGTQYGGETALGYGALQTATSSVGDVAIGYFALNKEITGVVPGLGGNGNVGIGWKALSSLTSGIQNVGLGSNTLTNLTTGSANLCLGTNACDTLINGANNVAIGPNTITGAGSAAIDNTTVGYASFQNITNGSFNVGLGIKAGAMTTSGEYNTYIGAFTASTTSTGNNNIALGYDIALPNTNGSNQLDIGNLIFGTRINGEGTNLSTGNIGIGTTTPYSRLTIWGPDTASTTAFAVVNNASTTVFASYDNGNATYSGSLFQSSDQRLKTNISSLDASSSLSLVEQLDPVSYTRIDQPDQGSTLGFIAQEVQKLFPNLVTMTAATALTPGGTLTLNYTGLIAPLVAAVQALQNEIASVQGAIAGFAQSFTSAVGNFGTVNTNQVCVSDSGGKTCLTRAQVDSLLAAVSQSAATSAQTSTTTPPVISINGANPAIIQVGASYSDLGATIAGPSGDTNLGIHTFVNGAPMSPVQIDTSAPATDTIDYVATDQNGLTSTSTRTVIVQALQMQAASSSNQTVAASSTDATSTSE